ncbi:MAG: tetratricopeptide repeat protein [Acidobacteria bacterium]|nr:tetratricopeptide repeat protein [Acidobacteriota bacterium]MCA1639213.1 tetratricopeptide repeat protein [Acidobacteriota bacterium]
MTRKILITVTIYFLLLLVFSSLPMQAEAQSEKAKKKQIETAKKLVAEGDTYYRQKDYQAAIGKYAQATEVAPDYALAHFSKGIAQYNLGQYDSAIEALNESLKQGYTPIEVYKIRWEAFYQKKNYDAALIDLQQILKTNPSDPAFNFNLGKVYLAQSAYQNALDAYQKASNFDPKNADVHYFMALGYSALNNYAQQKAECLKAIDKGTKYRSECWVFIGQALQKEKKYDEAAQVFEKILLAKPDNREVYVNLAHIYRILNQFDKAISTTKKGLLAFPNDGDFFTNLSLYYSLADQPQEAINAARAAVNSLPNKHTGFTNLCRAYNDVKQYDAAVLACTTALRLNPGDGESNFYLGRAFAFQKKSKIATECYKKAVDGLLRLTSDNPDNPDGFYLLGNSHFAVGQNAEAISAYKKSLELSPKFAKARYNLGYIYALNRDKDSARQQLVELQKIDAALAEKLLQEINK